MILSRNRWKRLKKTIEDEDMLNYLKYSHLDFFNEPNRKTGIDKATQFPETRNQSTQTIERPEKGVDTYDDLNVIIGDYILDGLSKNFDRNEKMVQVNALKRTNPNSPPSSSSGDDEGLTRKSVRIGLRFGKLALQTAITGATTAINAGEFISDLISAPHHSSSEDEENNPEVISENSSQPQTINSSQPQTINSSSAPTPTSMPAPTSPNPSTPASSAKTTPRKKSK